MWDRHTVGSLKIALKNLKVLIQQDRINSLGWCQKRAHLAQIYYFLYQAHQYEKSEEGVMYLYESMKIGYERSCIECNTTKFWPGDDEEKNIEERDVDQLFRLGLLAWMGRGKVLNSHLAFRCFTRIVYLEPFNLEAS